MGKPKGIGGTREARSETGSGAKTQGRGRRKPPSQQISGGFADNMDRTIKARAGHKDGSKQDLAEFSRAISVPIESERRLYFLILTRFLLANRYPLRWKTL
jgi:hypothetical protein